MVRFGIAALFLTALASTAEANHCVSEYEGLEKQYETLSKQAIAAFKKYDFDTACPKVKAASALVTRINAILMRPGCVHPPHKASPLSNSLEAMSGPFCSSAPKSETAQDSGAKKKGDTTVDPRKDKVSQGQGSPTSKPATTPTTRPSQGTASCSTITDKDHPSSGSCKDARVAVNVARIFKKNDPQAATKYYQEAAAAYRRAGDTAAAESILREMSAPRVPTPEESASWIALGNRIMKAAQNGEKEAAASSKPDCSGVQDSYLNAAEEFRAAGDKEKEKLARESARRVDATCGKKKTASGTSDPNKGGKYTKEQCDAMRSALAEGEKNHSHPSALTTLRTTIASKCD